MGMINLQDLEWGDVIHQGDGVVVCEAEFEGDGVVVKRWQQGVLDDELVARRLLHAVGIPSRELLGCGDGWMVLEDLSQSMWRPVGDGDLASARVVEALAAWLVQVHGIAPEGLSGSVEEDLLSPVMLALAAEAGEVSADELARLRRHLTQCLGPGEALALGGDVLANLWVLGDGLRAMSDGLQASHRGHPATDLVLISEELGVLSDHFLAAYCRHAGLGRRQADAWVEAAGARAVLVRWVATVVSGGAVDPELAAQLQTAIVHCCCR
ncbi:hypothetical protein EDD41_3101 [Luteococcus japonicus]|uniref:Streptomycin 6-kinase n=2 Tax=Luteococcus japonicus TaxID=33984 RepID=A0A3N1ZY94_9ACTN|nr:hypothetical protein EDD41_3101 [Luteococcus japonicus]